MNIAPKNINLSLLVMLTALSTYASPPEAPPQPFAPLTPPPPGLPIDGGVLLLVAVAIVYGVYALKKFNLQSK